MVALAAAVLLGSGRFKYRWVYVSTNLFVEAQVERTIGIIHRAAKAGYNGIVYTDTKLESLEVYPDFYRKNVQQVLDAAKADHVDVIPVVMSVGYAGGMLARNPSLIESMPCKQVPFVAKSGKLALDKNPLTIYKNGGFEAARGDTFEGFGYQDGPGKSSFIDHQVFHSGGSSIRMENPGSVAETNGNCRVIQKVVLDPWRQYRLSAWIKTQDFDRADSVRMVTIDPKGKTLSFGDVGVKPTQDWTQVSVVFNSQDNTSANAYIGVWGGNKGKMWIDDAKLEEVGLLNVTRRDGCPLQIKSATGMSYSEGRDVAPVVDPKCGNIPWPGEFEFSHEPPVVALTDNSRIKDGQRVFLDYYAAASTDSGKTALCLSDPASIALMKTEIQHVDELLRPTGFFLAHDEIRVMNWDAACQKCGLTPGRLLAENVRDCSRWVEATHPGANLFIWSDMFDPSHNAVDDYYLSNGSVAKSWEGIQKGTVVVNWNSGKPKESLSFFSKRGLKQILAGYYDAPVSGIKDWLKVASTVDGIEGVMYTTWADNYNDLESFAKAAWGQ